MAKRHRWGPLMHSALREPVPGIQVCKDCPCRKYYDGTYIRADGLVYYTAGSCEPEKGKSDE